jgi:anti-sigma-K factor RskA
MDHDATREQLQRAAVEPGGLDRLMAGDTPVAQAVAAHLAGCAACTEELGRLTRASALIRDVVAASPPADLRERTLAAVRASGVPRGEAVGAATATSLNTTIARQAGRGRLALGWVAAIAAAVVVSVVATSVIVGGRVDERLAAQAGTIEALQDVALATLQVTAEPDVRRVTLAGTDSGLTGSLIFSPSTSELVVVATGLGEPPAGQEYRCWVEQGGNRQRVGKMFFSDDLAYWIGPAPAVAGLVKGATFGVSLVNLDGTPAGANAVLDGRL